MNEYVFSILICSLHKRAGMLTVLLRKLYEQRDELNAHDKVEILIELDGGELTTGAKRNKLLQRAKGVYVSWIDDDDEVYPYYILEILKATESNADCFSISGIMTTDGKKEIGWQLSKDYENSTVIRNGKSFYIRKTNHISPVRRELALKAGFNDVSNGEDKFYSEALNPFLKTEFIINPLMYHYKFTSFNKEYK